MAMPNKAFDQPRTRQSAKTHPLPGRSDAVWPRGDAVTRHQAGLGNLAVQQLFRAGGVQAKLTVSAPTDPDEQEADRIAYRVTSSVSTGTVQRKCATCSGGGVPCSDCEEEQRIQAKRTAGLWNGPSDAPHPQTGGMNGGGERLSPTVRRFFEKGFARDFSRVRIHTNQQAAESARSINARAFTIGADVVFGQGEYDPESGPGSWLLAHELTHVVQQGHAAELAHEHRGSVAPNDVSVGSQARAADRVFRQHDAGVPADPLDAGAPSDPKDLPGGDRYSAQAACVARLGGCTSTRDAGVVEDTDVTQYNASCRRDTQYGGRDIRPSQEECRQYTSGELIDSSKILRLQNLTSQYLTQLSAGEITLADAQLIDAALRHADAALRRGGMTLPALPPEVTPPPDMSPDGPAILVAGLPAVALASEAAPAAAAGPTLTLIQGGAAAGGTTTGAAVAGGAEVGTAVAGAEVAGGAAAGGAAATVGVVLIGVAVVVAVGLVIYFIVTLEDPRVDPTVPEDLDDASETIDQTLARKRRPRVRPQPQPLPEIGPLPNQRRRENQTCTNEVADQLQEEVDKQCKELPRACSETDDCRTLRRNWFRNERCARARERINEECFGGGDPGHREAAAAARRAEENCRELYRRKC